MDLLLEATLQAEHDHFWFRGFRKFVRPLLSDATRGQSGARLLDCGCGTGANLEMLGEFGRAFGFDLTWIGLEHARRLGRPRIARASIAKLPFRDARFDIVTSFDVLQCLEAPDEQAAVAEMFRVLREGGVAIVNVAAMDVLRGNHSVLSEEVRRYTRPRLRFLLERAGFAIERLTYANAALFPVMLVVRTLQRAIGLARPEDARWEITVPARFINEVLSAALALEARALRRVNMPFGSSLLAVARKQKWHGVDGID